MTKSSQTNNGLRRIGARSAPAPVSIETLTKFAEVIIRRERQSALDAQSGLDDLSAPSHDRKSSSEPIAQVQRSSLESLCGRAQSVKIKKSDDSEPSGAKIVSMNRTKKEN